LHSCEACGLGYTFPTPSDELLNNIYSGEYWMRERTVRKESSIVRLVHKFNELRLVATVRHLLRRLTTGALILEVGCGSGQLAVYLKKKGYNVEVTDISQDILEEIKRLHGIEGYCGSLEEIEFSHTYDAIIFNNVLEHLPDPVQALKRAEQLLTPRGLVFLEVPNIAGFQFKLFRRFWFPLQIPQHLFHFSPSSLQEIAHQASLGKIWCSTFSPRIASAGYVASIFPALRPDKIRLSWSKLHLFLYLGLQAFFLPLVLVEALAGKGSAIRVLYKKKSQTR
jgi:2-polyprenyl-3-methyl-5-hydroxy-6-metoxy-1,4-benzoquinol methylase